MKWIVPIILLSSFALDCHAADKKETTKPAQSIGELRQQIEKVLKETHMHLREYANCSRLPGLVGHHRRPHLGLSVKPAWRSPGPDRPRKTMVCPTARQRIKLSPFRVTLQRAIS